MMKTIPTLSFMFLMASAQGQVVLVNENFDSYTAGAYLAQSAGAPWTTWNHSPGGSDDVLISSEQAASGTNSGSWVGASVTGGPGDVVIDLGNQTEGIIDISFNMYIPSQFGGYFNVLHLFNGQSSKWAVEVSFPANGDVSVLLQGNSNIYGTYPHDQWFPVNLNVDLGLSNAVLEVNNVTIFNWPFNWNAGDTQAGLNQLAGVDFFAYAGGTDGAKFYVDDVVVQGLSTGIDETAGGSLALYPNPSNDVLHISTTTGAATWVLRDAAGRIVMEGTAPLGAPQWSMNIGDLPSGVYQFNLLQDGRHLVRKVVKG